MVLSMVGLETRQAEDRIVRSVHETPSYRVTGPFVSVVIPAYNEEKYLPSLLSALQNQTYTSIETIVVDNLSEDSTPRIAADSGAKVLFNFDFNIAKSRNIGARGSHGSILIFIDADTIPEKIVVEKTVESILSGMELVYTNHCCIDSSFQSLLRVGSGMLSPKMLNFNGCYMGVSRQAYEEVGGFDELCIGEDVVFGQSITERFGMDRVGYLRNIYSATSARRQKAEGYFVPTHFQSRDIRRYEQYDII